MSLIDRLRAAIDEDEAWARAACQAYPYASDKTLPPEGVSWEWVEGDDWEPVMPDPAVDEFVTQAGYNCWLATKETWPTGHRPMRRTYTNTVVEMDAAAGGHIIRHDPKRVLRRVAADREILALHRADVTRYADGRTSAHCAVCHEPEVYDPAPEDWPCKTLLALAKGYGIDPSAG